MRKPSFAGPADTGVGMEENTAMELAQPVRNRQASAFGTYHGSRTTSAALYPAWDLLNGGDFMEVTPAGQIVWWHEDIFHHHDAQWLPNGNLL